MGVLRLVIPMVVRDELVRMERDGGWRMEWRVLGAFVIGSVDSAGSAGKPTEMGNW